MQKYVLTTNLSPQLYEWLDKEAKARKATKRVLIEEALEKARVEEKKRRLAETFQRISDDPVLRKEMLDMAEEDINDWGKELDKIDGGYFAKRNLPSKPRASHRKRAGR